MIIVQINYVNYNYSTGRVCEEFRKKLENHGHSVYTVSTSPAVSDKDYRISSRLDMKFHALFARLTGKQGYFSKRATKKMLLWMKTKKPDVVILRNLHANFINLPVLFEFLSREKLPVMVVLDDCWWYTGKCTHYVAEGCMRWKNRCGSCVRKKQDIPSFWFDRSQKMQQDKKKWFESLSCLHVVGVSDWIVNEARQSYVFSEISNISRIYNWINLDIFKNTDGNYWRTKLGIVNKKVILGVASVWDRSKGIDRFQKLSGKLSEEECIVLVGKINDSLDSFPNIIHVPETHNVNELAQLYSMADVYVCLSEAESFGKTIAEALGCDTPVVVNNRTACPELVGNQCGFVVDSRKPEEVYRCISKACELKRSGTQNCRAYAEKRFDMKDCIEQFMKIFEEMEAR